MDWRLFAGLVVISFASCALLMRFSEDRVSVGVGIFCFGVATFAMSLAFFLYEHWYGEAQHVSWVGGALCFWQGR